MTTGSVRQLIPSVISPPQCEQMAMTLLCSTVPPIISGLCDTGADGPRPSGARPALTFADDDCEEGRVSRGPGRVVVGQGLRGLGCRTGVGPPGGEGACLPRGRSGLGGAA